MNFYRNDNNLILWIPGLTGDKTVNRTYCIIYVCKLKEKKLLATVRGGRRGETIDSCEISPISNSLSPSRIGSETSSNDNEARSTPPPRE